MCTLLMPQAGPLIVLTLRIFWSFEFEFGFGFIQKMGMSIIWWDAQGS